MVASLNFGSETKFFQKEGHKLSWPLERSLGFYVHLGG